MLLKKLSITSLFILFVGFAAFANNTEPKPKKSEKSVTTDDTIVSVAASNKNFTTLVAAVKAAGLVDVLNANGPYTVFAPVNAAFEKLPDGTVGTLLKPQNKELLTSILTYHVVAGKFDAKAVLNAIKKNKGKFKIKTVQGGTLMATLKKGHVILTDAKGNHSKVIITDVTASNGIVHAIDTVVMPK